MLIINALKNCCLWIWKPADLKHVQKVAYKTISENQHESFMRQTIQPIHQNHSYQKSQPSTTNTSIIKQQLTHKQLIPPPKIYKSYIDCISQQHPFFELLKSKLQQLPSIFQIGSQPQPKVAQNNYNLKIHIKQSQDERTNIFVYSFQFPTSYQFYEEMQNNFQLQSSFDNNIDAYQCQEKLDENTKLIYLAYKKILIVSPRDFIYVRYTFKKDNQNWSVATSIPDAKTIPGKQRGNIILTATRAIQKDGKLFLTVYSQVDMKMPVKASAAKVRGITEIKKYLDKCYDYVQKQTHSMI